MASRLISPWAHLADELRAEARELAEEDNQLGLLFREAQWDAYAAWDAWDQALGGPQQGSNLTHLDARRKERRERQPDVPKLYDVAALEEQSIVEGESCQEESSLMPVGRLEIEGISYDTLADTEGNVFLYPYPGTPKTHLVLDTSYRLDRIADDGNLCRIVDFEVADLQHFFAVRQREPHRYQIRFIE